MAKMLSEKELRVLLARFWDKTRKFFSAKEVQVLSSALSLQISAFGWFAEAESASAEWRVKDVYGLIVLRRQVIICKPEP
jgi:hypothetical protein